MSSMHHVAYGDDLYERIRKAALFTGLPILLLAIAPVAVTAARELANLQPNFEQAPYWIVSLLVFLAGLFWAGSSLRSGPAWQADLALWVSSIALLVQSRSWLAMLAAAFGIGVLIGDIAKARPAARKADRRGPAEGSTQPRQ